MRTYPPGRPRVLKPSNDPHLHTVEEHPLLNRICRASRRTRKTAVIERVWIGWRGTVAALDIRYLETNRLFRRVPSRNLYILSPLEALASQLR